MIADKISVMSGDIVKTPLGDIHKSPDSFDFTKVADFYISKSNQGVPKAWKIHKKMTLRLSVIEGLVRFVFVDIFDLTDIYEIEISSQQNIFITVSPRVLFGFVCLSSGSASIINLPNIKHSEAEVERYPIDFVNYNWGNQ